MNIFEDNQEWGGPTGERSEKRPKDLITRGTRREAPRDVTVQSIGDIDERAERSGSRERIADADEDLGSGP